VVSAVLVITSVAGLTSVNALTQAVLTSADGAAVVAVSHARLTKKSCSKLAN